MKFVQIGFFLALGAAFVWLCVQAYQTDTAVAECIARGGQYTYSGLCLDPNHPKEP